MERLTSKDIEMIAKMSNSHIKTNETLQQVFEELYRYKKIEEEIECPLEVRCKLYEGQEVYDKTNRKCEITHLYKRDFMVKAAQDITFRILYKNYKKTWWTKEDASE